MSSLSREAKDLVKWAARQRMAAVLEDQLGVRMTLQRNQLDDTRTSREGAVALADKMRANGKFVTPAPAIATAKPFADILAKASSNPANGEYKNGAAHAAAITAAPEPKKEEAPVAQKQSQETDTLAGQPPRTGFVIHEFRLRKEGPPAYLELPMDLTEDDCKRLSRFVEALAF